LQFVEDHGLKVRERNIVTEYLTSYGLAFMATMFSSQSYLQPERILGCTVSFVYFEDVLFRIFMSFIKNLMLWSS